MDKTRPAVIPLRNFNKADFGTFHMSKAKPEIANPFIPSLSPVCRAADLALILSVTLAGIIAAAAALVRSLS